MNVDHLTDQERTAIAQLGIELPELMPRVGLGDGLRTLGQRVAGKHRRQRRRVLAVEVQPQFLRQAAVEEQQFGGRHGGGLASFIETGQVTGVGVVEGDESVRHWLIHVSGTSEALG